MSRVRTHQPSVASQAMLTLYIVGTVIGVTGLEGGAPFWPCALLTVAGTLLSIKTGKKVLGY